MSEAAPTPEQTPAPEPDSPATGFHGLTFHARRIPNTDAASGRWELYTEVGGVPWVIASKKLGGLDDDLQELSTPGFKEKRAKAYADAIGRPRTEPGPGA